MAYRFQPPTPAQISKALGNTTNPREEPQLRKFLEQGIKKKDLFPPIPIPGVNDWLANHTEDGQTFNEWNSMSSRNVVDRSHQVIYLLPILKHAGKGGGTSEDPYQFLQLLKNYAQVFYLGMEVKLLPGVSAQDMGCKTRIHEVTYGVKREQLLASDVMAYIQRNMPHDAYCVVGVTMCDLYPRESWNFVFGMASLVNRSGVFSFARYHPKFFDTSEDVTMQSILALPPHLLRLALRRSFEVLSHEIGHMFGMHHCIYFSCLLNGSNHQHESDSRIMFLCPVCLRKLKHVVKFDVLERYKEMLRIFHSLDEQFPLPKQSEVSTRQHDDKIAEAIAWLDKAIAFFTVDCTV